MTDHRPDALASDGDPPPLARADLERLKRRGRGPRSVCAGCGDTEAVVRPTEDGLDFHCGACGRFLFN